MASWFEQLVGREAQTFSIPLPGWIGEVPGKVNQFVVDPDIFYPTILKELGAETKKPDRYWIDVAFGVMKLDFDMTVRLSKRVRGGHAIIRYVRADDGRKQRWNRTMFAPGQKDFDAMPATERAREIRKHFWRIRGFVPSGL